MQPSNPSQQPSGASPSLRSGELPTAAGRQTNINNVAMTLRPVAHTNVSSQSVRQTSVLQTPQKQLVQVSPAVNTTTADSLMLMKLPVSTPVQLNQQTTVPLKQLLSQPAVNNALPSLIKLSPEALSQPLSKAQIQSLVTVLAQAHRTPLSIPAEIVSLNNNTVHLQIGALDGSGKRMVDIPVASLTQALPNNPASATKAGTSSLLDKLNLPAKATLTLTPSASRTEWQAALTLQSATSVPGNAVPESGNTTFKAFLQSSSPTFQSLFKSALTQGVSPDLKSITQWAERHLPSKSVQQLQRFSGLMPVSVAVKAELLMLTGSQAQITAVDSAPTKAVLNALPTLNQQVTQQLNSQALSGSKFSRTEFTMSQGKASQPELPTTAQQSTGGRVKSPKNTTTTSPTSTAVEPSHVKPEPAGTNLAQQKLAELSPEVKSAIDIFIRTANRLNVVNTNTQPQSVANLVMALEKISSAANASSDTSSSKLNTSGETSTRQSIGVSDKPPSASPSANSPTLKGADTAAQTPGAKALSNVIAQLQLEIQSKVATASSENMAGVNNTAEPAVSPKAAVADTQQVSSAIKQLMTSAAWLQSPATLVNPPPGQSFISGLLQVLQVSLLGRHFKQHTDLEQVLSRAKNATGSSSASGLLSSLSGRQIREFAQLDSQQNLLKQLKGLLAGHQSAKLANLDQALQGQDSFYYVLPALHQQQQSSELLIRREKEHKDNNEQEAGSSSWNLTMKLSIGEQGELLTKVKIKSEQIFLDIYTSNQELLEKVGLTLPFLLKRFAVLGLDVQEHKVQLGKIPDTLATKPFQLLETQA